MYCHFGRGGALSRARCVTAEKWRCLMNVGAILISSLDGTRTRIQTQMQQQQQQKRQKVKQTVWLALIFNSSIKIHC
jgi:hypothetical protein